MTDLIEINFDGLVGPSHHYGGLGLGNLASIEHKGATSHPRAAALQGLDKMRTIAMLADPDRMRQAILAPQPRPLIAWLESLGFQGTIQEKLAAAADCSPTILSAAWSVASMWTANAATVTPATDTLDGHTHITVSNLTSTLHRSLEAVQTYKDLRGLFRTVENIQVHEPLTGGWSMRDEGAANHMRFSSPTSEHGFHVFVHEPTVISSSARDLACSRFPARQSQLASQIIAQRHRLPESSYSLTSQHPESIDAGAFHNDVVATSHENLLLCHELAFQEGEAAIEAIATAFSAYTGSNLEVHCIRASQLSLGEAVSSYLFNSQIIPLRSGGRGIICPAQCQENKKVADWLKQNAGEHRLFRQAEFIDLRESMANGGGPACLRLRVSLPRETLAKLPRQCWWTPEKDEVLREIITREYPETLSSRDLLDPDIARATLECVSRLRQVLGWGV